MDNNYGILASEHVLKGSSIFWIKFNNLIHKLLHDSFCKGHRMYFVSSFIVTISLCIFNICIIYKIYSEDLFFPPQKVNTKL